MEQILKEIFTQAPWIVYHVKLGLPLKWVTDDSLDNNCLQWKGLRMYIQTREHLIHIKYLM